MAAPPVSPIALAAEARAGVRRADLFWAIDSGALGFVAAEAGARPGSPRDSRRPWHPVSPGSLELGADRSGRRTLPYNPPADRRRCHPEVDHGPGRRRSSRVGWAPAYGAFQSFVTAMRLLEGEAATREWLRAMRPRATSYAGELGVVMGVERGRGGSGPGQSLLQPAAEAGSLQATRGTRLHPRTMPAVLLNASGVVIARATGRPPIDFIAPPADPRGAVLTSSGEAYEIPLVAGVEPPRGLAAARRACSRPRWI
ncbi:MAG: hypothetical protein U5R48_01340 [Gammaproteobacteria bacterium]|nr:hypothetical protein [Gammaproteobacteria bacterium]